MMAAFDGSRRPAGPTPNHAESRSDGERIAELEAENARLRAHFTYDPDVVFEAHSRTITDLNLEIDALRREQTSDGLELGRLRRQLAQTWQPLAPGTEIDLHEDGAFDSLTVGENGRWSVQEYVDEAANTCTMPSWLPDGYAFCRRQEPQPGPECHQ